MTPGLNDRDKRKLRLMAREGIKNPQKLHELTEHDAGSVPHLGDHTVCEVSENVCELMKQAHEDQGIGGHLLANEFRMSKSTVHYHLSGKCKHTYTTYINEDRCVAIREAARDGKNHKEISDIFTNVSRQQARYHAVGECSCNHDVPPVEAKSRGCWAK